MNTSGVNKKLLLIILTWLYFSGWRNFILRNNRYIIMVELIVTYLWGTVSWKHTEEHWISAINSSVMKYITIHVSCIITSSQSISHSVTIFILTGIDHSSNVKPHGGISGVVKKFLSCQSFWIIDYTTINDYDDVQMTAKLWCNINYVTMCSLT